MSAINDQEVSSSDESGDELGQLPESVFNSDTQQVSFAEMQMQIHSKPKKGNILSRVSKNRASVLVTNEHKKPMQEREKQWKNALRELVETERNYIKQLQVIKDIFVIPLTKNAENTEPSEKPILDSKLIQRVFSDLEIFLNLHKEQFLGDFENEMKNGGFGIGRIFIERANLFKFYTAYMNKYEDNSTILFQEEQQNSKFRAFLRECHSKPAVEMLTLNDFLIKPLHRLTRYILLLKELRKNCEPQLTTVADDLDEAITKVSSVTSLVNDRVRDAENRKKVASIDEELHHLVPNLVQSSRSYVAQYTYYLFAEGNKGSAVSVYVFNDLIVTAKKTREFWKDSFSIRLFEMNKFVFQPDIAPPNSELYAVRLYDHENRSIEICTDSFSRHMDLVRSLTKLRVMIEGVPSSSHRHNLSSFPKVNLVVFGDKDCGKNIFLKTLKSVKKETYTIPEQSKQQQQQQTLNQNNNQQNPKIDSNRDLYSPTHTETEIFDTIVIPIAFQKKIFCVCVHDTYIDEKTSFEHKKLNREKWETADLLLYFVNLEKSYQIDYWKLELSTTAQNKVHPLLVVNCHETREPQKGDIGCQIVCRTLDTPNNISCIASNSSSVKHLVSGALQQVVSSKEDSFLQKIFKFN